MGTAFAIGDIGAEGGGIMGSGNVGALGVAVAVLLVCGGGGGALEGGKSLPFFVATSAYDSGNHPLSPVD